MLMVGGNANNGSNDGLACVNARNGLGNANQNYGSRLNWYIFSRLRAGSTQEPCLLAKNLAEAKSRISSKDESSA